MARGKRRPRYGGHPAPARYRRRARWAAGDRGGRRRGSAGNKDPPPRADDLLSRAAPPVRWSRGSAHTHTHARAAPAPPSPGLPSAQLAEMCKILNKVKQRRKGQGARRRAKPRARREVGAARRPPRCKRRPTTRSRCSRLIRRGAGLGGGAQQLRRARRPLPRQGDGRLPPSPGPVPSRRPALVPHGSALT